MVNMVYMVYTTKSKFKRIVVSENIYQQLKKLGNAGESFNDVIVKILKEKEKETI